jgi:N6-adenosine-specific RNA methylase IME4
MEIQINRELKGIIPPLTTEEYEGLELSILNEGCRDALVLWNETLVDGHNRYEICTKNNIEFKTTQKEFENINEAKEWIINNQFSRRNITLFQRSVLVLTLKKIFEFKAKENQKRKPDFVSAISPKQKIDTRKELAKISGVGENTIAQVEKILEKGSDEVKRKLEAGSPDMSINKAFNEIMKEEKKEEILKKAEEYKVLISTESNFDIDIFNTDKKFNIIYADPAWKYWEGGDKNQSLHYDTMTVDEICNLPVKNIADENSILFIWVTFPILDQVFKVIESWGFRYSTCGFIWVKKNKNADSYFFGNGSWTRANSELCLIATKGKVERIDATISQVLDDKIMEHSEKPARVRKLITQLVGELPKIELFSRNSSNDGWYNWGNNI